MINRIAFCCLSVLALSAAPGFAHAQEDSESAWNVGGSAAVVTDYIFRGISQTDESPAIQGGISVKHDSGFAASIWGSSVDFNDGDEASAEMDVTLTYTFPVGPGDLTLGGNYYIYPGADSALDYNFVEAFGGYAFNVADVVDINAQVFYSPDFFADTGESVYVTTGVTIPVKAVDGLSAVGSVGRQWIDDNARFGVADYTDWSAGLSYTWKNIGLAVKYHDTSLSADRCNDLCDSRIVGSLSASF